MENLRSALDDESMTCIRYAAFAEQADVEVYPGAAKLFRAAARAKKVHAQSHQRALNDAVKIIKNLASKEYIFASINDLRTTGAIKTTVENLQWAIDAATFKFQKSYPVMIGDAVSENNIDARHSLEYVMSIDMEHAMLFKKAKSDPGNLQASLYHICPVCGHTAPDKPPKKCPYCGVDEKKFIQVP